ncbi:hypothetical protein EVAR_31792_1 [Eumeta japonica]|uniref:Uncharacterized protein n=1 Tax=Eumeta variegata TaxID=151549 RepID=A0A4C1W6X4_EUMVA|nr:hypothetical protein EVAR_31792_1 [Eumeta japonica]
MPYARLKAILIRNKKQKTRAKSGSKSRTGLGLESNVALRGAGREAKSGSELGAVSRANYRARLRTLSLSPRPRLSSVPLRTPPRAAVAWS